MTIAMMCACSGPSTAAIYAHHVYAKARVKSNGLQPRNA